MVSSPVLSLGNLIWEESFIGLDYHGLCDSFCFWWRWCDSYAVFRVSGPDSPVFASWLFVSCVICCESHIVSIYIYKVRIIGMCSF